MLQYLYPQASPVSAEPNGHPAELTKMGPYPPINLGGKRGANFYGDGADLLGRGFPKQVLSYALLQGLLPCYFPN